MHNDHRTCMYVTPSVHGAYDYIRWRRFVGGNYDHTKSSDKLFISHKIWLPLVSYMMIPNKVAQMRDTFEKVKIK